MNEIINIMKVKREKRVASQMMVSHKKTEASAHE
jgi:hypothetical protein